MKEHTFLPGNPAYVMRRMNFLRGAPGIYVVKGIHFLRGKFKGNPPKRRKMLKHNYWYDSRAGARAIRDKCEQSLNNHGNDCKDVPSRSCTLSRQWRNLSNFLPLNLCDAANGDFSKTLKASVRNVYCWFTKSCFGDWELPSVKSCEAIFSWSLKHNYHYGEFPKHKCPKATFNISKL